MPIIKKNNNSEDARVLLAVEKRRHLQISESISFALSVTSSEVKKRLISCDAKDIWLADSGVSKHITCRREWFSIFTPSKGGKSSLGDDEIREILGSGTVPIKRLIGGKWHKINLENGLYVPCFKMNLFSVGECTDKKYDIVFYGDSVGMNLNDQLIVQGIIRINASPSFQEA